MTERKSTRSAKHTFPIHRLAAQIVFSCMALSGSPLIGAPARVEPWAHPFQSLTFFLQPFEAAGTRCEFEVLEVRHGYRVQCGVQQFRVHFFARPYRLPTQDATEVLLMIQERGGSPQSGSYQAGSSMVSVWVNNAKGSVTENLKVSLGVLDQTATLDVRVTL